MSEYICTCGHTAMEHNPCHSGCYKCKCEKWKPKKIDMNYWKRRYDTLLDVLKEDYGASVVICLLEEVDEQMEEE